jgi:hypothetical protein
MLKDLFETLARRPLDPSVPLVLKRLAVRLAILLFFATLPIAGGVGFKGMLALLAAVNALMCVVWALLRREPMNGRGLTHWDEALVMTILWLMGSVTN